MGLDEHTYDYTYMGLDRYRARQSLVGLSAHCKFLHPANMYMLRDAGIRKVELIMIRTLKYIYLFFNYYDSLVVLYYTL